MAPPLLQVCLVVRLINVDRLTIRVEEDTLSEYPLMNEVPIMIT